MDLEKYLKDKAEEVNRALDGLVLPGERQPKRLHSAIRYSLFAGGKRVRPILLLSAVAAVGGVESHATGAACAFECIHTYSLIHDDLPAMDDDDLRRGKPTCHKAFDEPTAILAGDALLTFAFGLLASSTEKGAGADAVLRVITELSKGAGSLGMIGGQMVDIESEEGGINGDGISLPELQYIHIHKTGALIVAAVRSGAILGGASEEQLKALTSYGESVGLAFQIADDILDVEGESTDLGKSAGADEKRGKATYPALLGLSESKERARELVGRAVSALDDGGFDESADPLREIARYIVDRKN
ncbi:MAG: farnesyl diphosphate synthase [Thermodesulfobacteriota bacterium]